MKNLFYIFLFLGNLSCNPPMYYPQITKQSSDSSKSVMDRNKLLTYDSTCYYYKVSFYRSFQKDSSEDFNYRYLNTFTGTDRNLNKIIHGQSPEIVQEVFIRFNTDGTVHYIAPYKYRVKEEGSKKINLRKKSNLLSDSLIVTSTKPEKWRLHGFLISPEYEYKRDKSEGKKYFQMILFKPIKNKEFRSRGIKIDSIGTSETGIKLSARNLSSDSVWFLKKSKKIISEVIVLRFQTEKDSAISINEAYVKKAIHSRGLSHTWISAGDVLNYGVLSKYDNRRARLFFKATLHEAADSTKKKVSIDSRSHLAGSRSNDSNKKF